MLFPKFFQDRLFGEYRTRLAGLLILCIVLCGVLLAMGYSCRKEDRSEIPPAAAPIRFYAVSAIRKEKPVGPGGQSHPGNPSPAFSALWKRDGLKTLTSLDEKTPPAGLLAENDRILRTVRLQTSGGPAAAMQAAENEAIFREEDPSVLHHAGVVALASGDRGKARCFFRRVLRIAPFSPATLFNLAQLEFDAGDYRESARLLALYRQRDPGNPIAAYRTVICSLLLGQDATIDEQSLPATSAPGLYARAAVALNHGDNDAGKHFSEQARATGNPHIPRFESDLRLLGFQETP